MAERINVSVPIDTEGINAQFTKLLLESELGPAIKKAIEDTLKDRYRIDNFVSEAVKSAVQTKVTQLVKEVIVSHEETIKNAITERVTENFVIQAVGKFWDCALEGR